MLVVPRVPDSDVPVLGIRAAGGQGPGDVGGVRRRRLADGPGGGWVWIPWDRIRAGPAAADASRYRGS